MENQLICMMYIVNPIEMYGGHVDIGVTLIEYIKVIARAIVNKEKIMSMEYILYGQKKAIRKIYRNGFQFTLNFQKKCSPFFPSQNTTPKTFSFQFVAVLCNHKSA